MKFRKTLGVKFLPPLSKTTFATSIPVDAKEIRLKGVGGEITCTACGNTERSVKTKHENGVLTIEVANPASTTVECRPVVEYELAPPEVAAASEEDPHARVTVPTLPEESPLPARPKRRKSEHA